MSRLVINIKGNKNEWCWGADSCFRKWPIKASWPYYDRRSFLGYASQEALRQSIVRNTVPVPVFKMEKRRGYFVLVKDVANYLAQRRYAIKAGGSYID